MSERDSSDVQGSKGKKERRKKVRARTRMIHGPARTTRWEYEHHVVPPMTASTTFRLDSSQRGAQGFFDFACDAVQKEHRVPIYVYERLDEPTRGMLEENLAAAEGGDSAVCFSSGMAAVSAALCTLLEAGHELVAHRILYGCTYSLVSLWLPRMGVKTVFADLTNPDQLADAITPRTRVVYFETPVNPTLQLIDIAQVAAVVTEANRNRGDRDRIRIVVDNTFATPVCQRPLEHGADVVVHSLTKDIGGFGTEMGGAVICPSDLHNQIMLYRKDFGGVLSPAAAWTFLVYGLPSLATRMDNQQSTARHISRYLEEHPAVERVSYPGLDSFPQAELARRQMRDERGRFAPGSLIYFRMKGDDGGQRAAERVIDAIARDAYTITLAVSLGHVKTLIENPYSMTHSALPEEEKLAMGVEPGGIRLSVGLEDRQDLIADLEHALSQV